MAGVGQLSGSIKGINHKFLMLSEQASVGDADCFCLVRIEPYIHV